MTNADRIREMSDEELAKFLDDVETEAIRVKCTGHECKKMQDCWECILEWLTMEAQQL